MPPATAEAAGWPGWPGSKMRTDFCSVEAAEGTAATQDPPTHETSTISATHDHTPKELKRYTIAGRITGPIAARGREQPCARPWTKVPWHPAHRQDENAGR